MNTSRIILCRRSVTKMSCNSQKCLQHNNLFANIATVVPGYVSFEKDIQWAILWSRVAITVYSTVVHMIAVVSHLCYINTLLTLTLSNVRP